MFQCKQFASFACKPCSKLSVHFFSGFLLLASGCTVPSADVQAPPAEEQVEEAAAPQSSPPASSPPAEWPAGYTPSSAYVDAKFQVGPWYPATWNVEEPFINILHASELPWEGSGWKPDTLLDAGHIDPDTGLITSFPAGLSNGLASTVYYTSTDKRSYDGEWVLEWDGDADMHMEFIPDSMQRRVSANRIEFTRDEGSNDHARIRVTSLGAGGLTGLRLFRAEYEDELDAGQIYSPAFIDNVSRAHVVRTMDLQEANRAYIHRIEQVAPMTEHFWNSHAENLGSASPHRSMPLEAVAALGVEADVEIWHHAPMELGATTDFLDPAIHDDNLGVWSDNAHDMAEANIATILASPEWDRYADAFVAALGSAGYPEGRTLYTTVSNEVWNFAQQYYLTTLYAWGAGQGYGSPDWHYRHGYGLFMGRWMLALEDAFDRAGRNQNVVYVVEGQAANPDTSRQALMAMQIYVEDQGQTWGTFTSKIGLSVASYWGGDGYYHMFPSIDRNDSEALHASFASEVEDDPVGLARRLADFYVDGPDDVVATSSWVVKRFQEHSAVGLTYGVTFIGAYEGGSHDVAPSFFSSDFGDSKEQLKEWYASYMWGVEGARVNNSVNDALAQAFPGIILSNYVTYGPSGSQPWFDGYEGENLAMQVSWSKYYRP